MSPDGRVFDGRVPPPDFVAIETTKYCNLRCEMCLQFQDGTTVTGPHMRIEEFERWAGQLFPFVTRFQPTVSGEPLMSKGLPRMLKLAEEHGVKLEMTSNGTLLNERMRRMLLPSLGKITISFDGGTKEIFEAMREGADFETVCENVRALCREVAALPPDRRPIVDLLCVLRRLNIRDIVNLVDVAHGLGVRVVHLTHMYPPTEELKSESLVHEPTLARKCIERALARAKKLGMTLTVQPLDQLTAASATAGDGRRHYATVDGVVEGLEEKSVDAGGWPSWPVQFAPDDPDHDAIQARRAAAWEGKGYRRPIDAGGAEGDLPKSIWFCDYLWNKTYVGISGHVTPCCVPGAPKMGELQSQPFEAIWNSEGYRRMRLRMALQDPDPFCKGCQHIHELADDQQIRRVLQGRPLPSARDGGLDVLDGPPVFQWKSARNSRGYEIEFSIDGFATVEFSSSWHGPLLDANYYRAPGWAWELAPRDRSISWRAVALLEASDGLGDRRFEVGHGRIDFG